MLTGIIIGAAIFGGPALAFIAGNLPTRHVLAQAIGILLGLSILGAALGALFALPKPEPCPEGTVLVKSNENAAGASGCVPHDTLKEIAR